MADVIYLAHVRDDLKLEIYRVLALGIEVALDMLTDADWALLTNETCVELILSAN